jgi:hypothetical protein
LREGGHGYVLDKKLSVKDYVRVIEEKSAKKGS